ncbi:MAG: gamma-glutamyltransferase [Chloroflexi bacterium]|nr:MAG: gamma-glutamyltransferase [Chloroflexota bacterium]
MKPMSFDFKSRRSMVVARRGMVAASNPMASQAGLNILRQGGNAADAAIAAAAVMNVTAPASTGIGGDCFAIYYDAKTKQLSGLNGSGRAPQALTIDMVKADGHDTMPFRYYPHAVTVPGAVQGWADLLDRHGTMTLADVLVDAIHYARDGFGVSPVFGTFWGSPFAAELLGNGVNTEEYLPNGRGPNPGDIMHLKGLAKTFQAIAEGGPEAFYTGPIADAIVSTLQRVGGVMTHDDLKNHHSTWEDLITVNYHGVDIYEIPPNGQGIAALQALNIASCLGIADMAPDDPQRLHLMVEAMRLAFADARYYVADMTTNPAPIDFLLSEEYAQQRRERISNDKAMEPPLYGRPLPGSDTIYLCTVDGEGNACSFINSLFMGFGSVIVAKDTGIVLQNRGAGFSLDPDHPNALAGGKRPYHTIIPGMAMKDGELYGPFGVMGGYMQPQGHFQVINAMVDDGLNPQEALDRPRWCLHDGTSSSVLSLEEGIPVKTMARLAELGHKVKPVSGPGRGVFGSGQIIRRDPETGVLFGGSDPRKDGLVAAY